MDKYTLNKPKIHSLLVRLAIILGLLFTLFNLSACSANLGKKTIDLHPFLGAEATLQSGVLTVGVLGDNSPFSSKISNTLAGLDCDIAALIADNLGLKLSLVEVSSSEVKSKLEQGEIDIFMSGQSVLSDTKVKALKAGPYIIDGPAIFASDSANAADSFDVNTLTNTPILVVRGSTAASAVAKVISTPQLVEKANAEAVFSALANNEAKFAASTVSTGSYLARNSNNISAQGYVGNQQNGVYIATAPQRAILNNQLNSTINSIRYNGELSVVLTKWLGAEAAKMMLEDPPAWALLGYIAARVEATEQSSQGADDSQNESDSD